MMAFSCDRDEANTRRLKTARKDTHKKYNATLVHKSCIEFKW